MIRRSSPALHAVLAFALVAAPSTCFHVFAQLALLGALSPFLLEGDGAAGGAGENAENLVALNAAVRLLTALSA